MGGMMGSAGYLWVVIWSGLALATVTGGIVVSRILTGPRKGQGEVPVAHSAVSDAAQDALRLRYASGEISREEYLQGKVELED